MGTFASPARCELREVLSDADGAAELLDMPESAIESPAAPYELSAERTRTHDVDGVNDSMNDVAFVRGIVTLSVGAHVAEMCSPLGSPS